jgi:hypothetical protein
MRCWISVLALLIAAPVAAQTAVILDFSTLPANRSGVDVQTDGGFALNVLGTGIAATTGLSVALPPATRDRSIEEYVEAGSDACAVAASPPLVAGLAIATVERRAKWWPAVARAECHHGLPPGLLDAVILAESEYAVFAASPAGAQGLTQLMPTTAMDLGVMNPDNPLENIDGGARYLRNMLEQFGSVALGLAAYNAGPAAVVRSKGIPANGETPDYVRRVFAFWPMTTGSPIERLRRTAQSLGFAGPS